jgi:hypothetical protein
MLIVWVTCVACGARSGIEAEVLSNQDAAAPHSPCTSADGVRICGGACPPIAPPACPGFGCTPAFSLATHAQSFAGVCWTDRFDKSARPCGACANGEVCIHRGDLELVCTSRDVCDTLWDLGARDVCRYTDLSPYDRKPIATSHATCPVDHVSCGESCLECSICTGRSPSRVFGICNAQYGMFDPPWTCSNHCAQNCAAFEGPSIPTNLALAYGLCLPSADCLRLGRVLGVGCYSNGTRVGP